MDAAAHDRLTSSSGPVALLREVALWRERARDDTRRVEAYRRAADALEALGPDEWQLLHQAGAWRSVPGVGASTAEVIEAAMDDRVPAKLAKLRDQGRAPLAANGLRAHLRGDLHTHSTWSDGGSPILQMALTASALGHGYLAVTDHSPRLRVANGLPRERLLAQWDEIALVQRRLDDQGHQLRLLRGIEVDILDDGSLDQDDDLLAQLDVVVASVHSKLQMEPEAMTRRMVNAVANPRVTVLGHCTGRRVEVGSLRAQSRFDAEVVFEACRQFGVAVEVNSRPERCDPPDELIALAAEIGCVFSVDTDAHAPGQLDFLDLGAARLEAAGVAPERVITSWPLEQLTAFASGPNC
ncbi:PHP domain-containing protein [Aestuariimicrobium ganziense]|uniref:PHP domain-containing protein n=1 Tax=Aestuariimicrobium ganziense TaxID=2773677 RepID=UPI001940706B|nr:PHP domain-containing protein [Aestuariimicrobium ganziense]